MEALAEIQGAPKISLTARSRLPRYVTARKGKNGRRYYWQRSGYPLERLPDDKAARRLRVEALNAWADGRLPGRPEGGDGAKTAAETAMIGALARADRRSKQMGWRSDLDLAFLQQLLAKQGWRCALTGLSFDRPFDPVFNGQTLIDLGARSPFAPSIDRVDSSRGYTTDNVRIVCLAVNVALSNWGDAVFLKIARAAAEHNADPSAA